MYRLCAVFKVTVKAGSMRTCMFTVRFKSQNTEGRKVCSRGPTAWGGAGHRLLQRNAVLLRILKRAGVRLVLPKCQALFLGLWLC